ncbi:MAG: hypothetical protein WKF83_14085 [Nocardioidaceae bacterium]
MIESIRRQIDASGVTYLYFQFASVTGRDPGQGRTRRALGDLRAQGLPAGVRRHRQPVHRPARRLHRLRRGGP